LTYGTGQSLIVVMRLSRQMAEFNRYVTNPIGRLWAGWAPVYGIIEHAGRRSGKRYRTPVIVFRTEDGLAVPLAYGPNVDWAKNLAAAGGGKVRHHGKTLALTNLTVVTKADAAPSIKGLSKALFSILPVDNMLLLTRAG
jgi:deazaflavin-dependent oxidoreductase (nitroreductase family)